MEVRLPHRETSGRVCLLFVVRVILFVILTHAVFVFVFVFLKDHFRKSVKIIIVRCNGCFGVIMFSFIPDLYLNKD